MKVILSSLLLFVFAAGLLAGGTLFQKTVVVEEPALKLLPVEEAQVLIRVPAVDENSQGVITEIGVAVRPGSGRTLASIESILFFLDTQNSIRVAREVAQQATGFDFSRHDLVYTVTANASVIEGPSAGAAIAIATIAAVQGREIRPDVMITGTIRPDGSIGSVGKVEEKARAAAEAGATLFLVPRGAGGFRAGYQRVTECRQADGLQVCETAYRRRPGTGLGIEVREVGTIEEALGLALEEGE